jgi:tetratricopeptide (TPR) repeat protein
LLADKRRQRLSVPDIAGQVEGRRRLAQRHIDRRQLTLAQAARTTRSIAIHQARQSFFVEPAHPIGNGARGITQALGDFAGAHALRHEKKSMQAVVVAGLRRATDLVLKGENDGLGIFDLDSLHASQHTSAASDAQLLTSSCIESKGVAYVTKAVAHLKEALRIAKDLGNHSAQLEASGNLGSALGKLGSNEAEQQCEEALRLARSLKNRKWEATALRNLGILSLSKGDCERARQHLEGAVAVARGAGDRQQEGQAISNLGAIYAAEGNKQRAKKCFEDALKAARESNDRSLEEMMKINLRTL